MDVRQGDHGALHAASWGQLVEHERIHPERILVGRALAGEHPRYPEQIIEWLEDAARGWNRDPTPFLSGALGALCDECALESDGIM